MLAHRYLLVALYTGVPRSQDRRKDMWHQLCVIFSIPKTCQDVANGKSATKGSLETLSTSGYKVLNAFSAEISPLERNLCNAMAGGRCSIRVLSKL